MKKAIISFLLIITNIVLYSKKIPTLKKIVRELKSYQTYQSYCERTFSFPYGGTMTFEANVVTQKVPSDTLCGFYYNFEIAKNTDAGETGDFSCYFNNHNQFIQYLQYNLFPKYQNKSSSNTKLFQ